jgi:hypothetical protein
MKKKSRGIKACNEAFQRLIDGNPIIDEHVGLPKSKITAGIVSVEAGYTRGYLKKSRKTHLLLLGLIAANRAQYLGSKESPTHKLARQKNKISTLVQELKHCKAIMEKVLTQNIQLVETVKYLEVRVAQLQDIKAVRRRNETVSLYS